MTLIYLGSYSRNIRTRWPPKVERVPVPSSEYPLPAARPADRVLYNLGNLRLRHRREQPGRNLPLVYRLLRRDKGAAKKVLRPALLATGHALAAQVGAYLGVGSELLGRLSPNPARGCAAS